MDCDVHFRQDFNVVDCTTSSKMSNSDSVSNETIGIILWSFFRNTQKLQGWNFLLLEFEINHLLVDIVIGLMEGTITMLTCIKINSAGNYFQIISLEVVQK